ncbi:MAG: phage virion morphogenesis protein [Pseudomonadota bacterium]
MAEAFDIELQNRQINRLITKLINARKTAPLMDEVGRIMVSDTRLNFRQQRGPNGEKWKPTARGGQILSDTGRLRNSIRYDAGVDQVRIGTNIIYGPIHQFGGTIKAKNGPYLKFMIGDKFVQVPSVDIPARPFIGIGSRAVDKINAAVEAWAEQLFR